MIRLAVDGMGGDFAPEPMVKGVLMALEKFDNIDITLFGDETKMAPFLKQHPRLKVVHTPHYLAMGEKDPIKQYRSNKELSMLVTVGLYVLNIIEANVDAHLLQYNLDENLALKPFMDFNNPNYTTQIGLSLNIKF